MLISEQILASRYEIVRRLNEGGMGTIYEAHDIRLKARVAIKENSLTGEEHQASFRREAQLLGNLSHPSLPKVTDYFVEEGRQYLVMEFIEGYDLAVTLAEARNPFPIPHVIEWANQLLSALDYLHNQPVMILHRDIKPLNLKVRDGRILLLDFGLAYGQTDEMSTMVRSQFNWSGRSPRYAPPEQLNAEPTTPSSDLYSLAATLYELLTGEKSPRCDDRMTAIQNGRPDPLIDPRTYRPGIGPSVALTIMKSLALEPSQRPQSAKEMLQLMSRLPQSKSRLRLPAAALITALFLITILLSTFAGVVLLGVRKSRCEQITSSTLAWLLRCEKPFDKGQAHTNSVSGEPEPLKQALEAEKLEQSANYDAAIKTSRAVLDYAPNYVYAIFVYGDSLWDTRYEMAETVDEMPSVQAQADKILALVPVPQNWEEYVAHAWANLAKGKGEAAIDDASKALALKPNSGSALMIRATARSSMDSDDNRGPVASLGDYNEVIRLMPEYSQAYANRGATYAQLNQYKLAISDYTEAIRLMPQAAFYIGRGETYSNLDDAANARNDFDQALTINPKSYRGRIASADLYFQKHEWSSAINEYTAALKIREDAYGFKQRGLTYLKTKQFRRAITDLTAAISRDNKDYNVYYARAVAYMQTMEWERVIVDCTKAITLAPENDHETLSDLYLGRAEAYRELGQLAQAQNDVSSARDLKN